MVHLSLVLISHDYHVVNYFIRNCTTCQAILNVSYGDLHCAMSVTCISANHFTPSTRLTLSYISIAKASTIFKKILQYFLRTLSKLECFTKELRCSLFAEEGFPHYRIPDWRRFKRAYHSTA